MDFTLITIDILEWLKNICGSYGVSIILLTIIVKVILMPLSLSQQRSMKKMQELSPKLKQIQAKYKKEPQKLQQKMMEFYKENKFNPLGGCFPLLLQLPVFIALYSTLISVPFLQIAGDSSFLFLHRLDSTLQSHRGDSENGSFSVTEKDHFITGKYDVKIEVNGEEYTIEIPDFRNALTVIPKEIVPGEPIVLNLPLDKLDTMKQEINLDNITKALIPVVDDATKEIEHLTFTLNPDKKELTTTVKTVKGENTFNFDVLALLILFGVTMYFSQKVITSSSSATIADPQQKAMQESMGKIMPFMIMAIFVIIPIPAGVLLYMVVSNIIQVIQTVGINKYLDFQESKKPISPNQTVIDVESENKEITSANSSPITNPKKADKNLSKKERTKKNKNKF